MSLTVNDFDECFLKGRVKFIEALGEFYRQMFEPVALDALAQQVRQLPDPVRAQLKQRVPQAWARLFGGDE